jgi:tetratricopeptide (TPR) repeat protein
MTRTLIALALLAGVAAADTQPWRANVTQAQQDRAKVLLDEGNALFAENKIVEALAKYRLALAEWNHPAIHFNVVRCLIQLDRTLEAAEGLEHALKYGAEPLARDVYQEALNYQKLLAKQIGDVEITCSQTDVALTLDGQPLAACPSQTKRRVLPGRHQVVGKKAGFMTQTIEVVVAGADRQRVAVTLSPQTAGAKVVHRWPIWLPWTVFGAGLLVGTTGLLFELRAIDNMNEYDDLVKRNCALGCSGDTLPPDDQKRRAQLQTVVGITLLSVGAATTIAAATMLYLNRGKTVYESEKRVVVVPLEGGAAVSLSGRF